MPLSSTLLTILFSNSISFCLATCFRLKFSSRQIKDMVTVWRTLVTYISLYTTYESDCNTYKRIRRTQESELGNGVPTKNDPVKNDEKHNPPEKRRSVVIKQARNR